ERAAYSMVAHARQILDAPAADQDHRVLLQIVALAADIRRHLVAVGQPHARHLAQSRVRLLGRGGVHPGADPALLRAALQGRHLGFLGRLPPGLAYQLIDRRHWSLCVLQMKYRPARTGLYEGRDSRELPLHCQAITAAKAGKHRRKRPPGGPAPRWGAPARRGGTRGRQVPTASSLPPSARSTGLRPESTRSRSRASSRASVRLRRRSWW